MSYRAQRSLIAGCHGKAIPAIAAVAVLSIAHVAVPGGAARPDQGADGPSPPRGRGGGHSGRDLPPAAAAVV